MNMNDSIKFIKTNSALWNTVNQNDYLSNIVFIEDIKQIWTNDVYYGSETNKIKSVTVNELHDLKNASSLIPGQIYEITDFRTTLDKSVGDVVYKEGEQHHLIIDALNETTLSHDAKSISFANTKVPGESSSLESTGDFELIAYKCDWDPDNSIYTEDNEYYKYVGETLNIDGEIYYIWNKYEEGIRLGKDYGKSTIATTSLDFECSIDNPYHIEYYINYGEINDEYQFEEPSEDDDNDPVISDSISRVVRIDKPVYNYHIKMQACDMDPNTGEYGIDGESWYEYNGDTVDIDGVTYFKWNKCDYGGKVGKACCPLTSSLYIKCSIENPYTPELWVTVDGELNNDYFDPTKTDIFCGIYESNLPPVDEIVVEDPNFKSYECAVKVDLSTKKIVDESQIVSAVAFKTKFNSEDNYNYPYPDYEGLYLYHGETMDIDGNSYRVWDKYSNDAEGFISIDYRRENDYFWAQVLTKDLYIDCSLNNPYVPDYTITSGSEEPAQNYEIGYDKIIKITYFNNITNYIRFTNNGWYVRCPELDRDSKFGWGYISSRVLSEDGNSYDWSNDSEDNWAGPIPAFMNTYNLNEDDSDFFLTDTLDPQVGDSFCRNDGDELDTIDKVWGTIIEPEISCRGIYHMKDEFGNEAPYDFKHIKFNNLYTFGNEDEDFSLNGFENCVYNNIIMKPTNSNYNRISISSKNVYGNTFYPSCTECLVDFEINESLISKSELGLHIFNPKDFITPIAINSLPIPQSRILNYTTTDEQIG